MEKIIKEINALAKKQREVGLTEEEKARQAEVRRIYIDAIKRNFKSQLDNIKVVEDDEKTVH
ncbi:MAG: DUF896 domain-containing protein [Clostridia bacterium]|nr:DUF896 domain-containing protein [Clostridia bacterium]